MLVSTASLVLAALVPVQDGGVEQARRTAEAARAITQEFGLVSWSEKLIDQGMASATGAEANSALLLARCDVLRFGSARELDVRKRLALRADAGAAYGEYMGTNPSAQNLQDARMALADIAFSYGTDLSTLLNSSTEVTEEERAELISGAEGMFTDALSGMNSVINWWEELGNEDPEKEARQYDTYYLLSFYRALTFLNWGRLYPAGSLEREQYTSKSLEYLEEFSLRAAGRPALMAYKHMADAYTVRAEHDMAFDYYQYVLDSAQLDREAQDVLINQQGWTPAQVEAEQEARQGIMQEAYLGMLRMLTEAGRLGEVEETLDRFAGWVEEERVMLVPDGWRIELLRAEGKIETGDVGLAIELADEVASENQGTLLQLEANGVMARAIAAAPPDAAIPMDILYQAAEGAYFSKDYWQAIDGFRTLLPRLAGAPDAGEYGGKAYYYLGMSWNSLQYPLLAGLAHQTGHEDYGKADEEFGLRNATRWVARSEQMVRSVPSDDFFIEWNNAALAGQGDYGDTPERAKWRQADRAHSRAQTLAAAAKEAGPGSPEAEEALDALRGARDLFLAIEKGTQFYEEAQVEAGICEYEMLPYDPTAGDRALAILSAYLDDYVTDAQFTPADAAQKKTRAEREPSAVFYRARTHRAMAKTANGDVAAHWVSVLSILEGFYGKYPTQLPLAGAAHDYRLEAFLAQAKEAEAENEFQELLKLQPGAQRISSAAYKLYRHYSALIDVQGVPAEKVAVQAKAAEYLGIMNANASSRKWQNLTGEAELRLAIGEPARAEALYQGVLDDFADDPSFDDRFQHKTRMALVDALLQQRKVGLAVPIIDEAFASRPKSIDVKNALIKVKLGFLLYEDGRVIEVPGEAASADPEVAAAALELAATELNTLLSTATAEAAKQEVSYYAFKPWWEAKLSQAYMFLLRGRLNPADAGKHVALIENLEFQAEDLGAGVGGENMQKCFQWLKTQR